MTTIPLPLLDGDTLMVDNSTIENHQVCARSAEYKICRRLGPSGTKPALKFGGIAHKVLDVRYRAGTPMYEQTEKVTAAMIAVANAEFHGIPVSSNPDDGWKKPPYIPPQDEFRNYDRMVDLIYRYGKNYMYESFDIVNLPDGRPFIEIPFAIPLGEIQVNSTFLVQNLQRTDDGRIVKSGEPYEKFVGTLRVVWMGRIDLGYHSQGGLYIMDHKTASIATNMAEFEISHQFYGYTWAAEILTGEKVQGTVINRMVCRKPTRTGTPFDFERKLIPTQRKLIDEWKKDMMYLISDFVEMVRRGYMPKQTMWCVGKFGTCPYHKVCSLEEPDQREVMLNSGEYEDITWSPLAENAD